MKTLKILILFLSLAFASGAVAQNVYTTKTGEKYHKNTCHYLKYSKKEYSLDRAIALGFTACSVCKPPKGGANVASKNSAFSAGNSSYKSTKSATAKQCTGKTQSGSRCKRKTKNTNQRCYQH
ncbi:hypothetical protein GCM10022291_24540 [Postechiella marina]|uniref:Uncharacterized protein n=1 Tax=Postechiella marina TaxID=943941 RepID=A0ABP8CCC8_9FLAO